jgi:SAM-dependent methyltransferase
VQTDAVDQLFRRLGGVLNPHSQSEEARDLGCYEDIGYPMTSFVEHLHAAYRVLLAMGRTGGLSFLDVGCGGGLKVFAAQRFFDQCLGLEFDRNFAKRARKLLRESAQGGGKIIRADAISYRKYSEYDVVFMFRPMSNVEQLSRLEHQVIDNIGPRTLIVAPYKSFSARASASGCPCIAGSLYLAKAPKSEAVRLRHRAEYMGLSIGQHQSSFPGFFDSILDAAARNGFRIEERNSLLDV